MIDFIQYIRIICDYCLEILVVVFGGSLRQSGTPDGRIENPQNCEHRRIGLTNQADMDEFEKQLKGKIRLLDFISKETNEILNTKEKDAVTRQIGVYEKKVTEIYELKLSIQELKLAEGQDPGEIRAWTNETQAKNQRI